MGSVEEIPNVIRSVPKANRRDLSFIDLRRLTKAGRWGTPFSLGREDAKCTGSQVQSLPLVDDHDSLVSCEFYTFYYGLSAIVARTKKIKLHVCLEGRNRQEERGK